MRQMIEPPTKRTSGADQAQAALPAALASSTDDSWLHVQPGTKVRLQVGESQRIVGTLLVSNDRSITIANSANGSLALPREQLTRVEVTKGRKGHWLTGAIVGAAMGALIGAVETPGCGDDGDCYTRGENIGYGSLGFGMVGALIGALYKTDEWVEVPANRVARADAIVKIPGIALSFAWRY